MTQAQTPEALQEALQELRRQAYASLQLQEKFGAPVLPNTVAPAVVITLLDHIAMLEVGLNGANERVQIMLTHKNRWRDRAINLEAELAQLRQAGATAGNHTPDAGRMVPAPAGEPHPPTRHCMCPDCVPSFADPAGEYPALPEPAMPASAGVCCGNLTAGAQYMGQTEMLCCGEPDEAYPGHYSTEQMRAYADATHAMRAGEQEPVAWRYKTPTGWHATTDASAAIRVRNHHATEPLYTSPVATQAEVQAEPVAWASPETLAALEMHRDVNQFPAGGTVLAVKAGGATEPLYAAPQAQPADALDERRGGKWLTVVYRDVQPGDEEREIGSHQKVAALSWSHALDDRDAAMAAAQEGGNAAKEVIPVTTQGELVSRDAAFEAVRKKLCLLPKYSFIHSAGAVRSMRDAVGNWIEFDAAHALFDPVAVDAAIDAALSATTPPVATTKDDE